MCGWGHGAPRDLTRRGLERLFVEYCLADPVEMDVWEANISVDPLQGRFDVARDGTVQAVPDKKQMSSNVLNYFSLGHDARAVFNFETHRRRGQAANTLQFAVEGGLLSLPFRGELIKINSMRVDGKLVEWNQEQVDIFRRFRPSHTNFPKGPGL